VVDDEELAGRNLRRKLLAAGGVGSVELVTDPVEAVERLRAAPPDLLLLDVRMPGLSGFEVIAHFPEAERTFTVVFCTAFGEHAPAAFEAAALDYLIKPVDPARLAATLARVRRHLAGRATDGAAAPELARARAAGITGWLSRVVARTGCGAEVVDLAEVLLLSSEAHRTVAYTRRGEHVLDASLAALEAQLDPRRFVRCHRAHLVQTRFVTAVEQDEVVLGDGRRAPLSRRCRAGLLEALRAGA
jgi:DNA-binding LytR/AlgR family response regulator